MNPIPEWYINFLKSFEGFSEKAYKDSRGIPTIGYGLTRYPDTDKPVKMGDTITEEKADEYLRMILKKNRIALGETFSNFENFSDLMKAALLDHSYRGGINNFTKYSPKFTKAIQDASADNIFTKDEIDKIVKEMELYDKSGNLLDRLNRRAAMLYGVYNPDDNKSINYATTLKSPYSGFSKKINDKNSFFYTMYRTQNHNADFINRLLDGADRQTISDWKNPKNKASHKLAYKKENNYDVVYPMIQTKKYKWYDPRGWFSDDEGSLVDYTDPDNEFKVDDAWNNAVEHGDTIHVPSGVGKVYVNEYKKRYPGFKTGGSINIKKQNKGKFTDYCGGKVTQECIDLGKHSSDKTTRMRAIFAENARKWNKKYQQGGTIYYDSVENPNLNLSSIEELSNIANQNYQDLNIDWDNIMKLFENQPDTTNKEDLDFDTSWDNIKSLINIQPTSHTDAQTTNTSGKYSDNGKFVSDLKALYQQAGITNPDILKLMITQDVLESGWGKYIIGDYNYGNIITGKNYTGKYKQGKDNGNLRSFRSYNSPAEYVKDKYKLLTRSYGITNNDTVDSAISKLMGNNAKKFKYAEAKDYDTKLRNTMQSISAFF